MFLYLTEILREAIAAFVTQAVIRITCMSQETVLPDGGQAIAKVLLELSNSIV